MQESLSSELPTRSNTNQVVHPRKMARGFRFRKLVGCSKNKGADQLRDYGTANLNLFFAYAKSRFSHDTAHVFQGLKLVYTRQADSTGRGPLTITGFAPYQSGYASGKKSAEDSPATSHQIAPGPSGFVVLDSTGSGLGTVDTQQEAKRAIKSSSKAGGTVQGHVKVSSEGYKTFFMLKSAEQEICPAHIYI